MSGQTNPNNSDWTGWIPIVVLFCIPYTWPVALFLLIRKLTGQDKKRGQARHPYDIQREWQERQRRQQGEGARQTSGAQGAQRPNTAPGAGQNATRSAGQNTAWSAGQGATRNTAQNAARSAGQNTAWSAGPNAARSAGPNAARNAGQSAGAPPGPAASGKRAERPKLPRGRGLTIAGAIVTGVFSLGFLTELVEALAQGELGGAITELVSILAFLCLGLVLLFCGLGRTRKGKRYRKYLGLIGKRRSVSIDALARATGKRRHKVLDDLQDMLDDGLLPAGYLDLARDRLVLSEDGIPDEEPEQAAQSEPGREPPQDDNAILEEIRAVNDAIPDPVMSAKIDRIGEITGKILDYQRRNPGKDSQLRSFLNYYLPTTLKILRAYAQLDAQGVEGENISAAKGRIEGMMDKVVEGFENQLDKLFRDSAMDISSDVAVLEQMLEKDGLSHHGPGMTLGGQ